MLKRLAAEIDLSGLFSGNELENCGLFISSVNAVSEPYRDQERSLGPMSGHDVRASIPSKATIESRVSVTGTCAEV